MGSRSAAARYYAATANAYLDADQLEAAAAAARSAGVSSDVLIVRRRLALGGPEAAGACAPESLARLGTLEDRGFAIRQRFKVLADCVRSRADVDRRRHAIDAFRLVDTARVTLVGMADVARRTSRGGDPRAGGTRVSHRAPGGDAHEGRLSIPVALPGKPGRSGSV
jgi:hypothetical protein